jgi:hypothetical protein
MISACGGGNSGSGGSSNSAPFQTGKGEGKPYAYELFDWHLPRSNCS